MFGLLTAPDPSNVLIYRYLCNQPPPIVIKSTVNIYYYYYSYILLGFNSQWGWWITQPFKPTYGDGWQYYRLLLGQIRAREEEGAGTNFSALPRELTCINYDDYTAYITGLWILIQANSFTYILNYYHPYVKSLLTDDILLFCIY